MHFLRKYNNYAKHLYADFKPIKVLIKSISLFTIYEN